MSEYDKVCIETFLRDQLKLFPEKVAETPEEAEDFLDMCMAAVCKNMKEVREYFDETGADISGMSKEELEQAVNFRADMLNIAYLMRLRRFGAPPEQAGKQLLPLHGSVTVAVSKSLRSRRC